MRKKGVAVAVGIMAVLIIVALRAGSCSMRIYDPNEELKNNAIEIKAGEVYEAEYERGKNWLDPVAGTVSFRFVPEESTEYTFRADNFVSDDNVVLDMHVMDESMAEYLSADNHGGDEEKGTAADFMEGSVFLTKDTAYYVTVEASSRESDFEDFSGSFSFAVNRAEEDSEPPEIKAGEKIRLTVEKDKQVCAVFIPEETGYYDFDSAVVSSDASAGFSSIADITSDDKTSMVIMDGVCRLEAGNMYYVWVIVSETTRDTSEVELSCIAMTTEAASGECRIEITGNAIIEYTAESDDAIMVSSESGGDPDAAVYDSDGFIISFDDNSGGSVSGNEKDFVLGLYVEKGQTYRIFIDGKFEDCTVVISKYSGDGTSPEDGVQDVAQDGTNEDAVPDAGE